MAKYLNLIAMAVILSLLLASCGNDDTTKPTSNNAPFTFLTVGNEWVYGWYDTAGVLMYTTKQNVVSEENGCSKIITDDDEDWYHYHCINEGGYYQENSSSSPFSSLLLLPRDCYVGLEYVMNDFPMAYITAEIISVSEKVTVPAGTFSNCIKVKEYHSTDVQAIN